MPDVTEAIYVSAGQLAVVEALGLPAPALWPGAEDVPEHFCAYRVLARLAREQLFTQAGEPAPAWRAHGPTGGR